MTLHKTNLFLPFLQGSSEYPGCIRSTQVFKYFFKESNLRTSPQVWFTFIRSRILPNLPRVVKYLISPYVSSDRREEATTQQLFSSRVWRNINNDKGEYFHLSSHSDFQEVWGFLVLSQDKNYLKYIKYLLRIKTSIFIFIYCLLGHI